MADSASVTSGAEEDEKSGKLESAERRISVLVEGLPAWDAGLTADDLIRVGKESVAKRTAAEALADLRSEE